MHAIFEFIVLNKSEHDRFLARNGIGSDFIYINNLVYVLISMYHKFLNKIKMQFFAAKFLVFVDEVFIRLQNKIVRRNME